MNQLFSGLIALATNPIFGPLKRGFWFGVDKVCLGFVLGFWVGFTNNTQNPKAHNKGPKIVLEEFQKVHLVPIIQIGFLPADNLSKYNLVLEV